MQASWKSSVFGTHLYKILSFSFFTGSTQRSKTKCLFTFEESLANTNEFFGLFSMVMADTIHSKLRLYNSGLYVEMLGENRTRSLEYMNTQLSQKRIIITLEPLAAENFEKGKRNKYLFHWQRSTHVIGKESQQTTSSVSQGVVT